MSSTIPLVYNHAGQQIHRDNITGPLADWSQGQLISTERQSLLNAIKKSIGRQVCETKSEMKGKDANMTLEAVLDDFSVTRSNAEYPHDFLVMDKSSGNTVTRMYGLLSATSKEDLVRSYANIVLELYRLPVPHKIGSISPGSTPNALEVIPKLGKRSDLGAPRVFETLEQYLKYLFSVKRRAFTLTKHDAIGEKDDTGSVFSAQSTISELGIHIRKLLLSYDSPCLRRFVLMHDHLDETNILTDDHGRITSILGWGSHSIQPAILAAEYPSWLSYSGVNDPQFAPTSKWWIEGAEESARLRRLFEEIVKERDPEYHQALTQGSVIRAAVGWLMDIRDDPACSRMRGWTQKTFGPSSSKPPVLDDSQCHIS
ncbi:hypothetical protein SERLADRAFT_415382 [Serpula lacrymans var. lacrymans S7.9]|uniref:Aminoglycoside phosphotransferase domain-containing protein n=1 Tax=Serpula lacrymans var. lacrymans (strain S7.9) TaxID=578457 RepID=F8NXZ0_SERL9|nr:uncharacterized protein SERLADRAFT_415382 [Serpula lacrymans var. lacrymans S7.9]EGO24182.1 hypothetical protein SERLADRAFT_415382 [Serpula lacrymans var. lacrymans S7.9]